MTNEKYESYGPRICPQCGGVNPGHELYTSADFRCVCLDANQPSKGSKPLEGLKSPIPCQTADSAHDKSEAVSTGKMMDIDIKKEGDKIVKTVVEIRNILLDQLIQIAESHESKSVHVDTLKQMKK